MSGWSVLASNFNASELVLGARCCFKEHKFNVAMNVSERYSTIEGWLLEGDYKVVEFFVCTLKDIFDANKK
jgi:hypothetical protein